MFKREREGDLGDLERWLKRYEPDCVLGVGKDIPSQIEAMDYTFPERIGHAHLGWHSSHVNIAGMNPK